MMRLRAKPPVTMKEMNLDDLTTGTEMHCKLNRKRNRRMVQVAFLVS
jgi:hypothetical protein